MHLLFLHPSNCVSPTHRPEGFASGKNTHRDEVIQAPAEGRVLGRKNWRKEIVCIMRVCDRGGKIPVVCVSVCGRTPPKCLNHFSRNFLGMSGDLLAVHI